MARQRIIIGDCRAELAKLDAGSVQCVVTSPPYWGLRDYKVDGQLGLEATPDEYLATMVDVFREVRRVLRDDGTCWVNMGDGYASTGSGAGQDNSAASPGKPCDGFRDAKYLNQGNPRTAIDGLKPKDLIGIPWRLAFALQADGWWLRSDIIWAKPNPMPESCTDRPTKAHEYVFLLTKRARYYYDAEAVKEAHSTTSGWYKERERGEGRPMGYDASRNDCDRIGTNTIGRNKRTVWTIPTQPFPGAHFATFPEALVAPCILAGTSDRGCCPECGAGWVRVVEKSRRATRPGKNSKVYVDPVGSPYQQHAGSIIGNRDPARHTTETTTTGWRPGCECLDPIATGASRSSDVAYNPVPCTVLDPFAGSGTVGVVCKRTGRDFIGIELSPEYAEMAHKRIANPDAGQPVPDVPGQTELFNVTEDV